MYFKDVCRIISKVNSIRKNYKSIFVLFYVTTQSFHIYLDCYQHHNNCNLTFASTVQFARQTTADRQLEIRKNCYFNMYRISNIYLHT